MRAIARTASILVLGAGVLLGGCATKESVEHAQASADSANSAAASARSAADRAQSSADGAAKMAQDALSLAQQANDKVDKLAAQIEESKHIRRHHRRHTAAASGGTQQAAACPPTQQQKTELTPNKRQAVNGKKDPHSALAVKTARN